MAHSTNTTSNEKTKMATSGIREGYWFYFNDESVDIAVNGSMWSGRETVYVNDNPVSDKREMFKVKSSHTFTHAEQAYRVSFEMDNILTGRLECSLFKNNRLIAKQEKAAFDSAKSFIKIIGVGFLFGLLIGGAALALFMQFAPA